MSVTVYSRLGALLRAHNLTNTDLTEKIEAAFGLSVDQGALDELTQITPIREVDIELAAAATLVLGVGLDDLLEVRAPSKGDDTRPQEDVLGPEHSRRLEALYTIQGYRSLTEDEQAELEELVAEYGHLLHERRLHDLAERRGLPVEQVRRDVAQQLDEAIAWWQDVQADPERLDAIVAQAQRQSTLASTVGSVAESGDVMIVPREKVTADSENPARQRARATLAAAGILATDFGVPEGVTALSDEDIARLGQLAPGARPSEELVDEDRGLY